MLDNLNILLGVTGGVAAYKAVDLASKLTAGGVSVNTVMTESACRLIGPKSFEAVTQSAVFTSLWDLDARFNLRDPASWKGAGRASSVEQRESRSESRAGPPDHIALVDWADIVVVAPATANIIGKIANGICDDLLSTALCACWPLIKSGATLLAPAMNNNMWSNAAVQRNVKTVKEMGFELIGPVKGRLACGTEAIGRMAEPRDILEAIEKIALKVKSRKHKAAQTGGETAG
ncbi:MAG: flavoprotein [Planctomycetota bacterium]|jgi:phosphopantothenoylcysteine decarboxylase/phosphopantothenate--cysteine ligase